jgi:hypothetical protein
MKDDGSERERGEIRKKYTQWISSHLHQLSLTDLRMGTDPEPEILCFGLEYQTIDNVVASS